MNILEMLLNKRVLSSCDQLASNSNQYFNTLKNNGIELVEVWKPNLLNTGKHKARSLHLEKENIERAERYLKKLQGVNNKTDSRQAIEETDMRSIAENKIDGVHHEQKAF